LTALDFKHVKTITIPTYEENNNKFTNINCIICSYNSKIILVGYGNTILIYNLNNNFKKWSNINNNFIKFNDNEYIQHIYVSTNNQWVCLISNKYNTKY